MNVDALFASPWGALLIFCLRIIDVSCDTMRVIFAIRGKRVIAASLGFIQALVWIFAVANAVKHLNSVLHVLGYAGGYAMGTYIGVSLEKMIAYGVATVRIVTKQAGLGIAAALREQGYGVTESHGVGRDGAVDVLNSVVQRRHLDDVLAVIRALDEEAFVTVEEPRVLLGGSIATREWAVGGPLGRWMRLRQRA
ncbi:MAG TPA: DUF5698 domain-containing protein [Gemmatimonadaceae bacterium]|jgi:uncharacterized protein YebE (UPF0316 family)|nr:DUF5698 domain-containing protein [Gemmatimonadaceae bacterium]